jgi:inner membrane protein
MDSVSQFVLGASVAAAALGQRAAAWKALLWGGVVATLPDLDVLIEHGDPIANMTRHRAESHALFWLTLASPFVAWPTARLHGETAIWRRWWLAMWLALVTHALLDAMTIYGTQLLLPFTDHPFAIGSLFVIDPLYTLPLLVGCLVLLCCRGSARGRRWNWAGLWLSTLYAAWSLGAQQWALGVGRAALAQQGVAATQWLATPAPLQTVLWRLLAIDGERAYEAFWSPFDASPPRFVAIDRGAPLLASLRGNAMAERLRWFSGDFVQASERAGDIVLTDLRMGQDPYYVFAFVVARTSANGQLRPEVPTRKLGARLDVQRGLAWLWPRMWGEPLPPPR